MEKNGREHHSYESSMKNTFSQTSAQNRHQPALTEGSRTNP
jgi:hypothetical protein